MPANNSKTQFKRSPSDDGKHVISLNESEDDRPRERSFTILRHHSMETSSSMRGSMRINSTFDDFDTTLFIYNSEELQEITLQGLQQIASLNSNKNIWLNVQTVSLKDFECEKMFSNKIRFIFSSRGMSVYFDRSKNGSTFIRWLYQMSNVMSSEQKSMYSMMHSSLL